MFFLFYLLSLLVCYHDSLYFYNNIYRIMERGENMNFKMDKNEDKINEEDISFIEFLTEEREDDTDFGRFLSRTNKKIFQVVEFLNMVIMFVLGIFNWITRHLFLICFIFVVVAIGITYFSQRLTLF